MSIPCRPASGMPAYLPRGVVRVALPLLLLALPSTRASAQRRSATLVGLVHDSTGTPLGGADVAIDVMRALTRSDTSGAFRLRGLDPGKVTVNVRRFGYDPKVFELTLHAASEDSISVTMQENAQLLEAMRADATIERRYEALQEFYRRRAKGGGTFLTRQELERHDTNVLSDALREVPGLRLVHGRRTGTWSIRFESSTSKRVDCPPQYFVDGHRVANTEVDDYPVSDVEAIELYAGPSSTPLQFSQSASMYTCGTVVIWTRIPGLSGAF